LKISSIGLGTYTGDPDDMTDYHMYDAIKTSVLSGAVNHLDTAPNYRYSKSEKTLGKALTTLFNKYDFKREELFISSKVGFVPEDVDADLSQREHIRELLENKLVREEDI
jgi:aryl-alcohol dehydrogenase-like predicted oxidoreductase